MRFLAYDAASACRCSPLPTGRRAMPPWMGPLMWVSTYPPDIHLGLYPCTAHTHTHLPLQRFGNCCTPRETVNTAHRHPRATPAHSARMAKRKTSTKRHQGAWAAVVGGACARRATSARTARSAAMGPSPHVATARRGGYSAITASSGGPGLCPPVPQLKMSQSRLHEGLAPSSSTAPSRTSRAPARPHLPPTTSPPPTRLHTQHTRALGAPLPLCSCPRVRMVGARRSMTRRRWCRRGCSRCKGSTRAIRHPESLVMVAEPLCSAHRGMMAV